jgi:alcohol dehydrogenase
VPDRPLLVAGSGTLARLPDVLDRWRPQRVLLVGSRRAVTSSGALGLLGAAAVTWFDSVHAPVAVQLAELVRLVDRSRPDVVVGLGGGTVLDTAKLGRALTDPSLRSGKLRRRPPRLVLVPTTAGSGAEMTRFARLEVDGRRRAVADDRLLADVAVVDPGLTASCPPSVTYPAAFDALAHALESWWSRRSSPASRALSWQALGDLTAVLADPLDAPTPRQRARLAAAATRAGRAVDTTRTGAVEAFAGWLTAERQVPHGLACLLTLGWLLPYHWRHAGEGCVDRRGPRFVADRVSAAGVALAGPGAGPGPAADALGALVRRAGWSDRLGAYGPLDGYVAAGLAAAGPDGGDPVRLDPALVARAIGERL